MPALDCFSYHIVSFRRSIRVCGASNEFMKDQGWTTDKYGRVKENGIQIYKAGYATAIQKILNLC